MMTIILQFSCIRLAGPYRHLLEGLYSHHPLYSKSCIPISQSDGLINVPKESNQLQQGELFRNSEVCI